MHNHECHHPHHPHPPHHAWPFAMMGHGKFGPFGRGRGKCGPGGPHGHHGPPKWMHEMLGRRHRRAERGEVRYLVLDAISDQARHGYEIIQTIESKSGGGYRPSPGTIYPTLTMLEEMGFAKSSKKGGKRCYEITDEGRTELEEHADEVEDAYDRMAGDVDWDNADEFMALFDRIPRLFKTVGRAFRRGKLGPEKIKEIGAVLDAALDQIDGIVKAKKNKD